MSTDKRNDAIKSILMAAMKAEKPTPAVVDGRITLGDFRYLVSENGESVMLLEYLSDKETVRVPGHVRIPGEETDRRVALLSIGSFMLMISLINLPYYHGDFLTSLRYGTFQISSVMSTTGEIIAYESFYDFTTYTG